MKKLFAVSLLSIVVVFSLLFIQKNTPKDYDYTLMIYMNGSNLESDYQLATDDIMEIMDANIGDNIAIVVETGGTNQWHTSKYGLPAINSESNQRWQLKNNKMKLLETNQIANMGQSSTLESFLNYSMERFPSDQYALIFWTHGWGPAKGICFDEKHEDYNLSLNELQTALKNNQTSFNKDFEFIGFDACYMANLETAVILSKFTNYFIASEATEPSHGWSYNEMINEISSTNNPCPIRIGEVIIQSYKEHSDNYNKSTLSMINLTKIDDVLVDLNLLLKNILKDAKKDETNNFLDEALKYSDNYSDMVDIIDYASNLQVNYSDATDKLIRSVKESIIINHNNKLCPNANGLSMYLPRNSDDLSLTEIKEWEISIELYNLIRLYN